MSRTRSPKDRPWLLENGCPGFQGGSVLISSQMRPWQSAGMPWRRASADMERSETPRVDGGAGCNARCCRCLSSGRLQTVECHLGHGNRSTTIEERRTPEARNEGHDAAATSRGECDMATEHDDIAPNQQCYAPDTKCVALDQKCIAPDLGCNDPPPWPKSAAEQIEAGRRLLAIRSRLDGGFKRWVADHCEYSYRSAALWMRAARVADAEEAVRLALERRRLAKPPVAGLVPQRFAASTMTVDEKLRFAEAIANGLVTSKHDQPVLRLPHLGAGIVMAMHHLPHATFGDLSEAAARAHLLLVAAAVEVQALMELADAYPPDGLVSSASMASAGD